MRPKLPPLLLAALATATIAAGCGDDDSDGASASAGDSGPITTSSLTKAQFVKQANAICVERREERIEALREAADESSEDSGQQAQDDFFVEIVNSIFVPTTEAQVEEIRELGAPKGDEKEIEKVLLAFEQSVDAAEELESQDAKAPVDKAFARAGNLAFKYGIDECAVG